MSTSDTNTLQSGGDVELINISLVNFNNEALDIQALFTEVNLFEDIFSSSLSGTVSMLDTQDIITSLPIIGEETLLLKFKTAGFPDEYVITHTFAVTMVTDIIVLAPHKQQYIIHFTTEEAINDLNKKVSKAYQGNSSKIIERILKEELATEKDYLIDDSSNNLKIVPPFWSPFKCINHATSRALTTDANKMANYLFFETNMQYRFASLNSLLNDGVVCEYLFNNDPSRNNEGDTSSRDVGAEMTKIHELRIDTQFNQLERLMGGAYAHCVWDHNVMLKRIDRRYYHYDNDFEKTKHLDAEPVDTGSYIYEKSLITSHVNNMPYTFNEVPIDSTGAAVVSRRSLLEQLNMHKLDITVHGRTDIEVGDCVGVTIGGIEQLTRDDKIGTSDYYNGKYLITAIMHRITMKKHLMIMQIAKESVNRPFTSWGQNK